MVGVGVGVGVGGGGGMVEVCGGLLAADAFRPSFRTMSALVCVKSQSCGGHTGSKLVKSSRDLVNDVKHALVVVPLFAILHNPVACRMRLRRVVFVDKGLALLGRGIGPLLTTR